MTLILILFTSVVVWLNRGQYDPSVPVLVAFFLSWAYASFTNREWFKEANRYLFLLPWIFAILFIFRDDLLYVTDAKREAVFFAAVFPDFKCRDLHARSVRVPCDAARDSQSADVFYYFADHSVFVTRATH